MEGYGGIDILKELLNMATQISSGVVLGTLVENVIPYKAPTGSTGPVKSSDALKWFLESGAQITVSGVGLALLNRGLASSVGSLSGTGMLLALMAAQPNIAGRVSNLDKWMRGVLHVPNKVASVVSPPMPKSQQFPTSRAYTSPLRPRDKFMKV